MDPLDPRALRTAEHSRAQHLALRPQKRCGLMPIFRPLVASCRVSMSMNTWNSQVLKNLVRFRAWNVEIFWRSRFLGTASQQVWGLTLRKALRQHKQEAGWRGWSMFLFPTVILPPSKRTGLLHDKSWHLLKPNMREQAMSCFWIEDWSKRPNRLVISKCFTGCALGARLNVSKIL